MLTIDLRKYRAAAVDSQKHARTRIFNAPLPRLGLSQIECERHGGAAGLLDVPLEINTMMRVELSLVTSTRGLVEDIGKAQRMEHSCRR